MDIYKKFKDTISRGNTQLFNNDEKVFILDSKENAIIYLKDLITSTYIVLRTYNRYLKDLNELIEKHDLKGVKKKKMSADIYIDYNYKIQNAASTLLNLIGDHTKDAMSYKKFRYDIDKNNNLNLGLKELDSDMKELLKEFNNCRESGLHIPEALLIEQIETIEKSINKECNGVKYNNLIKIVEAIYYEGEWFIDLYNETKHMATGFSKVLQQMKRDYSILIDETMRIEVKQIELRPFIDMIKTDEIK